jgi:two-component system, OmpR family, sensor histidine kinase BaeS
MYSIRRRLSIILIICSISAVFLSALLVNIAVAGTFNKYLQNNQNKRDARIIEYFQEVYKNDQKLTVNSGLELQHEAYMNNYCLTLTDENKNLIWGMDPNDLSHMDMVSGNSGIYSEKTYEIEYNSNIVGYVSIGQYSPVILSEDDINFKNSINISIALSGLAAIFAGVLISIFASRQFSKPIKYVSETSVKLANGKYDSNIDEKSNILEISNLIDSINTLGERLKNQDNLRKRLVTDISHEIRTPLNVLQNNLEAMIDGIFPANTERLESLNDEVIRFGKLLNNLDMLKDMEDENISLNRGTVDLESLISNVCTDYSIDLKEKNIELKTFSDSGSDYSISGDYDKLRQVFLNIMSNAVKFTGNKGVIAINQKADKDYVYIDIKDTGFGISEEDLPFIFERMYRGDKSRREIDGSGIGLAIVKNVLMLHSATIEVYSKEGNGTQFKMRFKRKL